LAGAVGGNGDSPSGVAHFLPGAGLGKWNHDRSGSIREIQQNYDVLLGSGGRRGGVAMVGNDLRALQGLQVVEIRIAAAQRTIGSAQKAEPTVTSASTATNSAS
jgi:hypothetical protein